MVYQVSDIDEIKGEFRQYIKALYQPKNPIPRGGLGVFAWLNLKYDRHGNVVILDWLFGNQVLNLSN